MKYKKFWMMHDMELKLKRMYFQIFYPNIIKTKFYVNSKFLTFFTAKGKYSFHNI